MDEILTTGQMPSDADFLVNLADCLENGPRMAEDSDMPYVGFESEWAKEIGRRLRELAQRV